MAGCSRTLWVEMNEDVAKAMVTLRNLRYLLNVVDYTNDADVW
jgi:hypothetical protein